MNEINVNACKECGKELTQLEGKRKKEFCNSTCRSNFWQKNERRKNKEEKKDTPKKEEKKRATVSLDVQKAIEEIKNETMPAHITSSLAKRVWRSEQAEKIEKLKQQA